MPKKDFWPFNDYKDGVSRHWEWLRRWLLANVRTGAAVLLTIIIMLTFLTAIDNRLPYSKELSKKYNPTSNIKTEKFNQIKVELAPTEIEKLAPIEILTPTEEEKLAPTEVVTRRFETTAVETASTASNTTDISSAAKEINPASFGKPMEGEVSVPYGLAYSPIFQDYRFNDGIDIVSTKDDQVKAVLDGIVSKISKDDTDGLVIVIDHDQAYQSFYVHIRGPEVTIGQKVKKGQNIGKVTAEKGTLHFAIKKGQQGLNPLQYFSY